MANTTDDQLGLFFATYPQFEYDPQEESWTAYRRLVKFIGWKTGSKQERKARENFRRALVGQFGQLYGADENKLEVLQNLCAKLGMSPIPSTITACKKVCFNTQSGYTDGLGDLKFAIIRLSNRSTSISSISSTRSGLESQFPRLKA